LLVLIFGTLSVSAVTAQPATQSYIVLANADNSVSASLLREIRAAGGTVTRSLSQLGMVVVSTNNPNFQSHLRGARSVIKNMRIRLIEPERIQITAAFNEVANPPVTGDDDFFFDLQWGADAVNAPEAWAAGRRGTGVRVAVLDEGVDADHPDLAPNVNPVLSKSFVPGEYWNPPPGFYFNHGTHVAGIIAAADNAFGVIGMAPEAEIIAVQVLSRDLGFGTDEQVIAGIKYAADVGADIVNMSLGSGPLDLRGGCSDPNDPSTCYTTRDIVELGLAYIRVVNYARQRGTSVIASAGNEGFDFRANPYFVHLPSDTPGVISVSALGPLNWATFNDTDLDVQTSYTNYGPFIDLSAPGGNFDYPGNEDCTLAGETVPCWVFDMVISDIPGGWAWAAGTSMAAPHVAGVAAQYIAANGGSMNPNALQLALQFLADDKGAPGRDDIFGRGRVDATLED
jgi:subtilisin family serine protease